MKKKSQNFSVELGKKKKEMTLICRFSPHQYSRRFVCVEIIGEGREENLVREIIDRFFF